MFEKQFKEFFSKRQRLRLKAGALALAFAGLTLLPWVHVITVNAHDGHGCCHHNHHTPSELPGNPHLPVYTALNTYLTETCWICSSLSSLLHSTVSPATPTLVNLLHTFVDVAPAPHTPMLAPIIFPASRSQAPPALI